MTEHVVYVLGAGASYDAGGPLIRDFFSRSRANDAKIYPRRFDNSSRYLTIEALYHSWAGNEYQPNMEKFFQQVSLNKITGEKFVDPRTQVKLDPETVERYLTWYIASYIRHSVAAQRMPRYYSDFAQSMEKRGKRYSVITFNYDMVLENAIIRELGSVDYGFGPIRGLKDFTDPDAVKVIKLHGSLNWLRCPLCGNLEISKQPVAHVFRREVCGSRCNGLKEPVIVPPVQNKEEYLGPRNEVWSNARRTLSKADRLIVIGYSLPDFDVAARQLLANSLVDGPSLEIVNRNQATILDVARKLGLIDPNHRLKYTPAPMTFHEYVDSITS